MRAITAVLMAGMAIGQTVQEPARYCFQDDNCLKAVLQQQKEKVVHKGIDWGKVDRPYGVEVLPSAMGGLPVKVESATSGTVVRISDAEYAKLQSLRQAVRDEETAIAKAHGVRSAPPGDYLGVDPDDFADHYEYRGQYLLINVPKE